MKYINIGRKLAKAYLASNPSTSLPCPPSVVNLAGQVMVTPPNGGQGVGTRLSNLDLTGRLVKRGLLVSYHGFRYLVVRVNRGYFFARSLNSRLDEPGVRLRCESVQVVDV